MLVPPSPIRGRRECRASDAPDSRVCNECGRTHTRCQVTPANTRHSPRNGLRLTSCSSRRSGFFVTVTSRIPPRRLTPASRRQNHTTSPSASSALVSSTVGVHRIPPRVRDDRDTPLEWDETMRVIKVIWFFGKPEYFCKRGWTGKSADDPTGKSVGVSVSSNLDSAAPNIGDTLAERTLRLPPWVRAGNTHREQMFSPNRTTMSVRCGGLHPSEQHFSLEGKAGG